MQWFIFSVSQRNCQRNCHLMLDFCLYETIAT